MYFSVLKDQKKYTACQDVHLKNLTSIPSQWTTCLNLGLIWWQSFRAWKRRFCFFFCNLFIFNLFPSSIYSLIHIKLKFKELNLAHLNFKILQKGGQTPFYGNQPFQESVRAISPKWKTGLCPILELWVAIRLHSQFSVEI